MYQAIIKLIVYFLIINNINNNIFALIYVYST